MARLFRQLRNVRPWGPADRLYETGLKEEFDGRIKAGEESVIAEIEIWFVRDETRRSAIESALRTLVGTEGGEVIQSACIPELDTMPLCEVADHKRRKAVHARRRTDQV